MLCYGSIIQKLLFLFWACLENISRKQYFFIDFLCMFALRRCLPPLFSCSSLPSPSGGKVGEFSLVMTKVKELFYTLTQGNRSAPAQWTLGVALVGLLWAFLVMLKVMIVAFKMLNAEAVAQILAASANPFLCLFIGLLTTALVHSSSTITAMTIAIVASGTISPTSAVYMIMGANIGTTITATMVALGHATRRKEFRKAISASMAHHFFNLFSVFIFFPLEYYSGFLTYISQHTAVWFTQNISMNVGYVFSPIDVLILPVARFILYCLGNQALLGIFVAVWALFYVLQFATKLFEKIWVNLNESPLQVYLFHSPLQALVLGTFITALLQSSTVVTSLIVPIVAANKISIKRVFPFIMGANLGTTFKAIILASSANESAMSVAFMHFYLNVLGILFFFPLPALRNVPVMLARRMGKLTLSSRLFGFGYISLIFFLLPFLLIFFSQQPIHIRQYDGAKETYFYKQMRLPEAEDLPASPTSLRLRRERGAIWFENDFFMLKSPQPCHVNALHQTVCLEQVLPTYALQHKNKTDSCYVFSIRVGKDNSTRLYFAKREGVLVRKEIANAVGKVIFREDLVNVMPK
ncbi:MAG: hypothetical protein EAZ95_01100 [Bacteroidetes bacterium]|nr:MAG: hypothetical protein EAZ95_01100 [Bacteroidota bacterium]